MPLTYQPKPQSPGFLTQALMRIGQMLGMDPHPQDQPYGLMSRSLLEAQPSGKPSSIGPLPEDKAYSDWLGAVHRANPDTGIDPMSGMIGGLAAGMAKVYHGSPHKFDAFDMSKIGTGEGAQAYGHGLYFADNPEVANAYRINLAYDPDKMRIGGKQINEVYQSIQDAAIRKPIKQAASDYEKLDALERLMQHDSVEDVLKYGKENKWSNETLGWLKDDVMGGYETFGSLYEVDLPDEAIGKMLDWDKPLSEQPESVLKNLEGKIPDYKVDRFGWINSAGRKVEGSGQSELTGRDIYNLIRMQSKEDDFRKSLAAGTVELKKRGIPGIKYLDQGSRGSGKGTYNYVVFDDQLPTILKRNNESLAERLMR